MGWQPIETAPKDGTKIDVWVRDFSIGEAGVVTFQDVGRVTEVYWGEEVYHYFGDTGTKREPDERWVYWDCPHHARLEVGGRRATHWMPLPAPPAAEEEQP